MNDPVSGGCVPFSTTTVKQYQERLQTGKWFYDDASAIRLHARCKQIDDTPGEGTFPRVALQIAKDEGIRAMNGHNYLIGSYYTLARRRRARQYQADAHVLQTARPARNVVVLKLVRTDAQRHAEAAQRASRGRAPGHGLRLRAASGRLDFTCAASTRGAPAGATRAGSTCRGPISAATSGTSGQRSTDRRATWQTFSKTRRLSWGSCGPR